MPLYVGAPPLVRTDQANTYSTGAQNLAAATSLLVPNSAGYAPTADGSLGYDPTQDAWVAGGAGALTGALPRVLSVQRSTTDTLDAATITTTETAFATTYTLPANYLIAGKAVRVRCAFYTTTSGSAPTQLYRLRIQKAGPTNVNLCASSAITVSNSFSNRAGALTWLIQGTAAPGAAVNILTTCEGGVMGGGMNSGHMNSIAQPVAADTTAAQTIQITLTYGAGTAGNTLTLLMMTVEELN